MPTPEQVNEASTLVSDRSGFRSIPWAKVLAVVGPVLLGAAAGAFVQYSLQRAHPRVTLIDVSLPTLDQSGGSDDDKLDISPKLIQLTHNSEYVPSLDKQETRGVLKAFQHGLGSSIADSDEAVRWIDDWSMRLDPSLPMEEKRSFLNQLGDHTLILTMLAGGLARSESQYLPTTEERTGAQVLFPYEIGDPGFKFYLQTSKLRLAYKDASFDQLLKPGADAIARFNVSYLKRILAGAKSDVRQSNNDANLVLAELKALTYHANGIRVRALIANTGGSTVSLTPWGTLRLFATGTRPDAVLPLETDRSSYVSVKPGESQLVTLNSVESVEQIAEKYPSFVDVVNSETVVTRLALKRADMQGDDSWIQAPSKPLTADEGAIPEARRVGASFKR